ncbi:MAG: neutral/alkaline non-lysosomal ceramidase N-terminal domain-containing protein, partial [Limisphaerales bacterium]
MKILRLLPLLSACAGMVLNICAAPSDTPLRAVGVARVDITPDYPIRLTGYGDRREESTGVAQRLFAKALAFGSDSDGPAVLVTVDNCGVPGAVRDEVARRLAVKTRVQSERFAVCSTHNHSAPMLLGFAPNIFAADLPAEQQAAVERYTRELTEKIEQAALAALADRRPARLAWGVGRVGFAANRRLMKDGKAVGMGDNLSAPVDHDLPVLRVTDADGKVRAILTSYACHCTTLTGKFKQMHGDWAGCAQEVLERDFPGAVALVAAGCGADA